MHEIDFFKSTTGDTPMESYLEDLSPKMRAKTLRSLQLLREFGPDLREPNTKPLEDGIFELRTIQGSEAGRSLFFFYEGQTIVITHGFLKKTQKTPRKEIKRAKKYRTEYYQQRENS